MNEKRKAPGSVGALSGAAEGETADNMFPCVQFITGNSKWQGQILDCLPIGADSPITAARMAELCGHNDQRKVSRQIEHLRRSGVPVCASCDPANPGYYRAQSAAELALYLHGLRGRMKEITRTYNSLESALNEWVGQATMWGDEANG